MDKQTAKENLIKIVDRFKNEFESGKTDAYTEEDTKSSFITPLLTTVLGWEVHNHDEVVMEYSISRGRIDYGMKIGNDFKFFVEAKQVSVDLDHDKAAKQAIAYGYNSKVPFVILTDFEGLKAFDSNIKPVKRNFKKGLKLDISWKDYVEKFDELWQLSKQEVLNGSLDKLSSVKAKDRTSVDKDILEDLEHWREALAKNIFKNNKKLFGNEDRDKAGEYLKEVTQKILDRIIFIRFCEDRQLTQATRIKDRMDAKGEGLGLKTYDKVLNPLFREYEAVFNSDLFAVREWEKDLQVEFKVMDTIVQETCEPYMFDVIPIEVLGNIYEQYLGHTIRLTPENVKYEEKPEVRKAGGVYYTPEYIVDYIVKNTVGKLLKELPEAKAKEIRILDPACGSGSFLIRAYEEMLRYYLDIKKKSKQKVADGQTVMDTGDAGTRLNIEEKARILKEHIYGVDIDEQAVEVTKLSLMLKMLQGEYGLVKGTHLLPMLDKNIRCGNSLVSGNVLELNKYFGDDFHKVKPFNWEDEFKNIIVDEGGFDAVIGNPPYFNISEMKKEFVNYLKEEFKEIHTGYNDIMYYFIYKSIHLLNKNGICGMITSNYYLGNSYARALRNYLRTFVFRIVNFKDHLIFKEANIHTNIILARNCKTSDNIEYFIKENCAQIINEDIESGLECFNISREKLKDEWIIAGKNNLDIINKVKTDKVLLGDISIIEKGSTSGKNDIFTISAEFAKKNKLEKDLLRKNVKNSDIERYYIKNRGNYLIYIDNDVDLKEYKNINKYLSDYKKILSERNEAKKGLYKWYRLERPRKKAVFDAVEKIVVPYRAESNQFAYDDQQYFNDGGDIRAIILKDNSKISIKYVLAILNSTLMNWYYGFIGKPKGNSREYFNEPMSLIPIKMLNLENEQERKVHDKIVALSKIMIDLTNKIKAASTAESIQLKSQIYNTDKEIDNLVFDLYNINETERKLIEVKYTK